MKYDDLTIQKLRELSILEVADKLGFKLKGLGDEGRRALCPYHDDKHPSLHFSKKKGIFKCFVCGAKGDLFKLVMDDRNCTFPEACEWLINEFHVVVIDNCPADCSATLRSSVEEMKEIKEMSPLENATRSQISAISAISAGQKIAIVESEKTAVILSEIVKDFIWMSCGGLQMFKPELLAPLVNHKVVVFPDTDETGEAYNAWLTVLQQAAKLYPFKHPLRISNLLEFHATVSQKQRKIDIVDFLFEVPQI